MSTSTSTNPFTPTVEIIEKDPVTTALLNVSTKIPGISIAYENVDADCFVTLWVERGSFAITPISGLKFVVNNTNTLTFTGKLVQITALLITLIYTGNVIGSYEGNINVTTHAADYGATMAMNVNQLLINVLPSSQPAVTTGPTASVAQGSTTTVSGVAVEPGVVTLANQVSTAGGTGIFTVTVGGKLGILSDVPVGSAIVTGSGSHSISVTGNLTDINATLSALKYTATSVGQDVLSMTASVAGTSPTSVGTKTINVGVLNTSIENTPKTQAIDLFYQAMFNRLPDADGLAFWASSNASIGQIANAFMQASEFTSTHGTTVPNAFFVNKMYGNLLGRPADSAGSAYWVSKLDSGASQAAVLVGIATSAESQSVNAGHFNQGFLVT